MKRFLAFGAAAISLFPAAGRPQNPSADRLAPLPADPAIASALRTISPDAIRADIA